MRINSRWDLELDSKSHGKLIKYRYDRQIGHIQDNVFKVDFYPSRNYVAVTGNIPLSVLNAIKREFKQINNL